MAQCYLGSRQLLTKNKAATQNANYNDYDDYGGGGYGSQQSIPWGPSGPSKHPEVHIINYKKIAQEQQKAASVDAVEESFKVLS